MLIFCPKFYDVYFEGGGADLGINTIKNRNSSIKKSSQYNFPSSAFDNSKYRSDEMTSPKAPPFSASSTPLLDVESDEVEFLAQDFEALKDAYEEQRDAIIVVNRGTIVTFIFY